MWLLSRVSLRWCRGSLAADHVLSAAKIQIPHPTPFLAGEVTKICTNTIYRVLLFYVTLYSSPPPIRS